jgi:predicted phage terminase large subunit-like protein
VRGKFPFEVLKRKVMEVKQRYGSSTLLIEDSPISRGLKEQSINVTSYKPDTDKRPRVIAQTDLFAGGSVRFPRRAAWLEEFTAELLAFPGRHDDQVDALTQGLAWGRVRRGEYGFGTVRGIFDADDGHLTSADKREIAPHGRVSRLPAVGVRGNGRLLSWRQIEQPILAR